MAEAEAEAEDISQFWILLSIIPFLSMSEILSRKGILTCMIWNSNCLIGVLIKIEPINVVNPIPNVVVTAPSFDLSILMLPNSLMYVLY